MPQRTRMFRVWTYLAGSMTTGALVLSWLEPDATRADARPPADLAAAVRGAVDDRAADLGRWTGIAVVDVTNPVERGSLVAVRSQAEVHFVLATTGQVAVRSAWRAQQPLDSRGRIRIGLVASPSGGNEVQVRALRALIAALEADLGTEGGRVATEVSWEASPGNRAMVNAVVRQLGEIAAANRV